MQDVLAYHRTGKLISCRLCPPCSDQTDAGLFWKVGFSRLTSTNLCLSRVPLGQIARRRSKYLYPRCSHRQHWRVQRWWAPRLWWSRRVAAGSFGRPTSTACH